MTCFFLDYDLQRGDGVYSRPLTTLSGSVLVSVSDNRGAAFTVSPGPPIINQPVDSKLPVCCGSTIPVPENRRKYLGIFQRNHTVTVPSTDAAATDSLPPAKIGDLSVVKTGGDFLTLAWTAVGGDMLDGQTDVYRVYFSADAALLVTDTADDYFQFTQYDMSGTVVNYTLDPGSRAGSVYLAIKAGDRFDNFGRMSNMVRVSLGERGAGPAPNPGAETMGGDWTLIGIILGVIFILVLSLFVLVISIVCGKKNKQVNNIVY